MSNSKVNFCVLHFQATRTDDEGISSESESDRVDEEQLQNRRHGVFRRTETTTR